MKHTSIGRDAEDTAAEVNMDIDSESAQPTVRPLSKRLDNATSSSDTGKEQLFGQPSTPHDLTTERTIHLSNSIAKSDGDLILTIARQGTKRKRKER